MSYERFVIDGYNLLHRGIGFTLGRDLEFQRGRVERVLSNYLGRRKDCDMTLVWDGAHAIGYAAREGRSREEPRLEVVFSKPPRVEAEQMPTASPGVAIAASISASTPGRGLALLTSCL